MSKIYYLVSDKSNKSNMYRKTYYFDNNSTTFIYDNDIKLAMVDWINCGNPSNILHDYGRVAHNKIEECRHSVAKNIKVKPKEIFFTSGATESNNIVIHGIVNKYVENNDNVNSKYTIITSSFEHPSVINVFKHYDTNAHIDTVYIEPCKDIHDNDYGRIKVSDVENTIKNAKYPILLVSIMYANNETGAIQDIKNIGHLCRSYDILFHCDATQGLGKYKLYPHELYIDAMSFSGHKFHGPKGIGGLYLSKRCDIMNLCFGGEQEQHRRPGTENVSNIVGMSLALDHVHHDRDDKNTKLATMSKYVIDKLKMHEDIDILGPKDEYRLPNTILMLIKNLGQCNKLLVENLNKKSIYISVGSACQTDKKQPSHVLGTLNIDPKDYIRVIRISLSDYTTWNEIEYLIKHMIKIIIDSRRKSK